MFHMTSATAAAMATPEAPEVFQIAEWNWNKLQEKIAKINRKAVRLGMPEVRVIVDSEQLVTDPEYAKLASREPEADLPKIKVFNVHIEGEGPKIAGYRFIGTLDHNTLPGQTIVQTVPGESIPHRFFGSSPVCDHCGKIRNRNETFVLEKEEDHTHYQIGRQCVRDFIGHDPVQVARYLSGLWKSISELKDDKEWMGGSQGQWMFDKIEILTVTVAAIRTNGWVPRSAANPEAGRFATAGTVADVVYPSANLKEQERKRAIRASLNICDADKAEAEAAVIWLATQPKDNEYLHNLHLVNEAEACPAKMIGYWCSLIAAYQRDQERLNLLKATKKVNQWIGAVGDKVSLNVFVNAIRYTEGAFGRVAIIKMTASTGETVTWFANGEVHMAVGKTYNIKGTVKKQDEYQDWKQTVLTRVKVL